jgi:hypothetical protein
MRRKNQPAEACHRPAEGGHCSKFLAHIKENICHNDEETYRWFLASRSVLP